MRRFDAILFWVAGLAEASPRWLRAWGPLFGAVGVPLTLCLFFVVLPVFFQRAGLPTDSPWFSALWLFLSALAVAGALFAALFGVFLALADPPADLRRK